VQIGDRSWVDSHVVIKGPTRIGSDNKIYAFCSIGQNPQDKKFTEQPVSQLEIGNNNTIREYCSINRGSPGGGGLTRLGNDNWIMSYCHIAHDCMIGNSTTFANHSTLAGHVEIGDYAVLGGFTGVHQFCRLGESSFTSISAVVVKDVPPFVIADGRTARPRGINRIGLQRRNFSSADITQIRRAYKIIYHQGNTVRAAVAELTRSGESKQYIRTMIEFMTSSKRGIIR